MSAEGCAHAVGSILAGVRTDLAAAASVSEGLWAARAADISEMGRVGGRLREVSTPRAYAAHEGHLARRLSN